MADVTTLNTIDLAESSVSIEAAVRGPRVICVLDCVTPGRDCRVIVQDNDLLTGALKVLSLAADDLAKPSGDRALIPVSGESLNKFTDLIARLKGEPTQLDRLEALLKGKPE